MASCAIYLYIYRLLYQAVKGRIPGYLSPAVVFSVILVIHGAVVANNIYQILSVEI